MTTETEETDGHRVDLLAGIENELLAACEQALDSGWTLVGDGSFGSNYSKCCCVLGAFSVAQYGSLFPPSHRSPGELFNNLGMYPAMWHALGRGFDGQKATPGQYEEFHAIGRRLREHFGVTPRQGE